ncbi:hypothetical protein C8R41DRAFT_916530 [Lentinula lateritia]|uniref:Uncharacterized protein n=1 Tax=Lentinula lateritia TaxID=40482 RepID=A0ABQ8VS30_9AGAR|nr:hypothetical protein C8R41DRAFT_916530 [Lentinula lateritia]
MLGRPRPPAQVRRASPSHSACWSPMPTSSQSISQLDTSSTNSHSHSHSLTRSELARLSDQNTELIQRLEVLEEETAVKERAGRRTVVKLEKEIQLLRDELDEARREAASAMQSPTTNQQTRTNDGDGEDLHSESCSSSSSTLQHSNSNPDSISIILEYLHCKITQLEDANVEICREQREAGCRLHDAQLEVEEMRRLWSLDGAPHSERTAIDLESELRGCYSIIQDRKPVVGLFEQEPLEFNSLSLIYSRSQSLDPGTSELEGIGSDEGSSFPSLQRQLSSPLPHPSHLSPKSQQTQTPNSHHTHRLSLSQTVKSRTARWSWSAIFPSTSSTDKITRVHSVVLEAWLWIQLLVVLGVFVWAVARRGPSRVLENRGRGGGDDEEKEIRG